MNTAAAIGLSAVLGFAVTAVLGLAVIPWLCRLQFGAVVPVIGSRRAPQKKTPTMGGLLIAAGVFTAFPVVLLTDHLLGGHILTGSYPVPTELQSKVISGIFMALVFGMIGFADDAVRILRKRENGMNRRQMFAAQILIAASFLTSVFLSMGHRPYMYIPPIGNMEIGVFYWIFGFLFLPAFAGSVRRTQTLDGLCGGTAYAAAAALVVIAVLRGVSGIGVPSAALAGSCAGFLLWRRRPAKVCLGSTGALFLGGMLSALAYMIGCPLILLAVGLPYWVEGLYAVVHFASDTLRGVQNSRWTSLNRRLVQIGWSEKRIIAVFAAVQAVGIAVGIYLMKR